MFAAKKKAEKEKMKDIEPDTHISYHIAKQMKQENKDIVGEKCIRHDNIVLAINEEEKNKAWKRHYERLLNFKFSWQEEDLSLLIQYSDPLFLSLKRWWRSLSSGICSELIVNLTNSIV